MARSTVAVRFTGDTADLKKSLGQIDGNMAKVGTTTKRTGDKFAKFAKAGALGFAAVAVAGKSLIDAGSDLNETLSKSNTVFRRNAKEIESWADTAASSFGQSKKQALEAASSFGNMFVQLGITEDAAADMSVQMTELASDFASFHNADITEVLQAQQAAFRGEYDAVQRFVPTITAAAVEQKALEMGLAATTGELTAQDKALATQALLMEEAGDAMGDFERTSSGLANTQRTLSAQFADVSAKIGQQLIPIALRIAEVLSTKVIPALDWFSKNETAVTAALAAIALGFTAWAISAAAAAAASLAAAWPLLVVAAAAAAAVAVLYVLSNRGDGVVQTFGRMVAACLAMGEGFGRIFGMIGGLFHRLATGAFLMASQVVAAFGPILAIIRAVWSVIQNTISAVQRLINILGRIRVPDINLPSVGGFSPTDLIPRFADGGVMPGPRGVHSLAMVAGGETILPTHKTGFAAGATVNVTLAPNISVPPTMDAGAAGQAITEALAAYIRRNGARDLRLLLGV